MQVKTVVRAARILALILVPFAWLYALVRHPRQVKLFLSYAVFAAKNVLFRVVHYPARRDMRGVIRYPSRCAAGTVLRMRDRKVYVKTYAGFVTVPTMVGLLFWRQQQTVRILYLVSSLLALVVLWGYVA
jgi:hypothetical protein